MGGRGGARTAHIIVLFFLQPAPAAMGGVFPLSIAAVVLLAVLKGGGARVDYCIIGAGPSGKREEICSHYCTFTC